jgi:hypothetical protein
MILRNSPSIAHEGRSSRRADLARRAGSVSPPDRDNLIFCVTVGASPSSDTAVMTVMPVTQRTPSTSYNATARAD